MKPPWNHNETTMTLHCLELYDSDTHFIPILFADFFRTLQNTLQTFSTRNKINWQSFTAFFFTPHRKKSSSAVPDPGLVSWLVGHLRLLRFCPWCYKTIGQGYIHTSRTPQHVLWRRLLFWWERSGVFFSFQWWHLGLETMSRRLQKLSCEPPVC